MRARVVHLVIDRDRVDLATELVRELVIPAFTALPGAIHGYWMLERRTGHAMTVTCWHDERSLVEGNATMGEVRARAVDAIGALVVPAGVYRLDGVSGESPPIEGRSEWSCVQLVEGLPLDGRRAPGELAATAHRLHDDDPGFHSVCWLVDPATGSGLSITSWADEASLHAAEPSTRLSRRHFESDFGCHVDGRHVMETLAASTAASRSSAA